MSTTIMRSTHGTPWVAELRACVRLSVPLVLTNAIEMAMSLTNAAMIGRISPNALAASALALALYNTCLMFGIGLTAAVSPLVARDRGSPDASGTQAVRRYVQGGLWNNLLVVGPIWLLMWQAGPIMRAVGQDPVLAEEAAGYLHAMQWSLLPALVYLVLRSMLAALERPRWTVVTGVVAVLLNLVLNWALIGGHGGLPALGLTGSGIATFLSSLAMACMLAAVVAFDPQFRGYRVFSGLLRPPLRACVALWRLGLPIGIGIVLEVGMFTAATGLIGHYDAGSLAAHAIALQIASFTFMVPLGIAQAAAVRVGRAAGGTDRSAVGRAGWVALFLGVGTMAISAVVLITVPESLIGLFIDNAEPNAANVTQAAVLLVAIAALFQIADGSQVVLAGMLRGLEDTRAPMLIAMVGYWGVGLPLAYALAARWAAPGVWIGLTAGLFTVSVLLLARWSWFRSGARRRPGV